MPKEPVIAKPEPLIIKNLKPTQAPITLKPEQALVIQGLDRETEPDAEPVEISYLGSLFKKHTYVIHPTPDNPLQELRIAGAQIKGTIEFKKFEEIVDIGEE